MRVRGPVALAVVLVGISTSGWARAAAEGSCQYIAVVDPCTQGLLILGTGGTEVLHRVVLSGGSLDLSHPTGVSFTTVPDGEEYAFVTHGPYLHVIDIRTSNPERTIPVSGLLFGSAELVLQRLEASGPVTVGAETRYPLYVIGDRLGEPWLLIFDQEQLLDEPFSWDGALLAAGPLCDDGVSCYGVGLDIAVGGPPEGGGLQEAFASVFNISSSNVLRFYRIVIHEDFSHDAFLDSWNDEGVSFGGVAQRINGLDYDATGTLPFGVFQTTSVVKNLSDGGSACTVSGHPTDVKVWGPGLDLEHPNFLFVSSASPDGSASLLGYPVGQCPDGTAATLELPVVGVPRALAVSSDTNETPWIYATNQEESILAAHVQLSHEAGTGDRIDLLGWFEIQVENGCPNDVAIRDESRPSCYHLDGDLIEGGSGSKPPSVDCLTYPDDPRCLDSPKPVHVSAPGEEVP